MSMLIQPGYQKITNHSAKRYHPFIYRQGQRRYAYRGKLSFKTATAAMKYAIRWADRAQSFLDTMPKEVEYADQPF